MFARVSRLQEPIDNIDESVRQFREKIIPQVETMTGFLGLESMVDRATGETLSITYWESEDAMRDSEAEANRVREEAAQIAEGEIRSVDRYEVVLRVGL